MADLIRRTNGPTRAAGIGFIKPTEHWCIYGKHVFSTTSRIANCCLDRECREKRKAARRERTLRARAAQKAKLCAN